MDAEKVLPSDNSLNENVFVYGTLRKGQVNHYLMKNISSMFLSNSFIKGQVFPTIYGFPCLMAGNGSIPGEIYATNGEGLKRLDHFEGAPTLYERRKVSTTEGMEVWVYFGTGAQRGIIHDQA